MMLTLWGVTCDDAANEEEEEEHRGGENGRLMDLPLRYYLFGWYGVMGTMQYWWYRLVVPTREEATVTVWVGVVEPLCTFCLVYVASTPSRWDLSSSTYGHNPQVGG